jgi:hypothetical protein
MNRQLLGIVSFSFRFEEVEVPMMAKLANYQLDECVSVHASINRVNK